MVIEVVLVGLGPIGLEVGRALRGRPGVHLAGGADPAPGKAGEDLGALLGGAALGRRVAAGAAEAYREVVGEPRVAVLCTGSRLPDVAAAIEEALDAGFHVVSTCEELAYPALRHAALAARLDQAARARGRVVLGTGVNPGLVMDRLPLAVAQGCVKVDRVRVERIVDAAQRRGPLRRKVGAGLTPEVFRAEVAAGRLGHVGLGESAALLARGLGTPPDELVETIEPVVADAPREGVAAGAVLGVRQTARALVSGRERVSLALEMYVGAAAPHDRIVVEGDPPLDLTVAGGFHGDRATVGAVVNALPQVVTGPAGLHLVTSLPLFGLLAG